MPGTTLKNGAIPKSLTSRENKTSGVMKKFVKLLMVIFLIALATNTFAQNIGIEAGLNLANQRMEIDGETLSDDFDTHLGFHAGLIAEFPLSMMVSFETGLLFTTRGFGMDFTETIEGETIGVKGKTNLYYLDIPITAKVNFGSEMLNFYGKLGPYIGIGLMGTRESEFSFLGQTSPSQEEDINWGSTDDDDYRRLDYGLTAGVGVEMRPVRLGVSYDWGLANIVPVQDDDAKINNQVIRISLAYLF